MLILLLSIRFGMGAPAPALSQTMRSLDAAILLVWGLAVALIAIELALAVSPLLGITVALTEGVVLGAGSGRLARLVTVHADRPD
jgi:hypothetical protein